LHCSAASREHHAGGIHVIPDNKETGDEVSVRDFFETDALARETQLNKSLQMIHDLTIDAVTSEGLRYKATVDHRLNLDHEANAIYSYFFIPSLSFGLFKGVCQGLIDSFSANHIAFAPPALFELAKRVNDADRYHPHVWMVDSRMIVIYTNDRIPTNIKDEVYAYGDSKKLLVKIRDKAYGAAMLRDEKPLAFISHDSRDKDTIARPLAQELTRVLGRVWFDEYSLQVGDSLRESIERGLKDCMRCILVLTPNFLSNTGWTKTEFNSVFTREIIERTNVVIPVWAGVTAKEVYEYSPSLADRLAANWNDGLEGVASKIREAILRSS
jgi:hypothetical protein